MAVITANAPDHPAAAQENVPVAFRGATRVASIIGTAEIIDVPLPVPNLE
jgi:hypothetical protein